MYMYIYIYIYIYIHIGRSAGAPGSSEVSGQPSRMYRQIPVLVHPMIISTSVGNRIRVRTADNTEKGAIQPGALQSALQHDAREPTRVWPSGKTPQWRQYPANVTREPARNHQSRAIHSGTAQLWVFRP